MSRARASGVAALLSLMLLAGCGGSAVVGSDRTVTVAETEYRLVPESIRVTQGTVTFIVHNDGVLTHSLSVSRDGQLTGASSPVAPGQTTALTVALTPGKYQIASTILDDQALGMYGTLAVTS